jgi:hypothetical protein
LGFFYSPGTTTTPADDANDFHRASWAFCNHRTTRVTLKKFNVIILLII